MGYRFLAVSVLILHYSVGSDLQQLAVRRGKKMSVNTTTYHIPPLVEYDVETAILEVAELSQLIEAIAQLGGPLELILQESCSESMQ